MALQDNQLYTQFQTNFGRNPSPDELTKFSGANLPSLSAMPDPTYALVPGASGGASTVYNKSTGKAYSSPQEFAQAVGANPSSLDWSKYKFDTSWQPSQQPYTQPEPTDPTLTPFDGNKAYQDAYTQYGGDSAKQAYTAVQSQINDIDNQMQSLKQQKLTESHAAGGSISQAQLNEEVANENQTLLLQKSALTRQAQLAQSSYNDVIKKAQFATQTAEKTYQENVNSYNAHQRSQFNVDSLAQKTSYQDATLGQKDAALQEKAAKDGVSLGDSSAGLSIAATRYNDPSVSVDPTPAADGGYFLKFSTPAAGKAAMGTLLQTGTYSSLSIDAALKKWGTNVGVAEAELKGMNLSAKVGSLSSSQLSSVVNAIIKAEGSDKPGSRGAKNYNPGNIKVPSGGASTSTAKGKASTELLAAIQNGTIDPNRVNSRTIDLYNQIASANVDAVSSHASDAAKTKAYQDTLGIKTTSQRLLGVIDKNLPLVANLADKVNTNGVPGIDNYINGVKSYTGNDANLGKYINSLKTLRTEYANMLAKGAAVTESERADAADAIPAGKSGDFYRALGDQLKLEGANVISSADDTLKSLFPSPDSQGSDSGAFDPKAYQSKYQY